MFMTSFRGVAPRKHRKENARYWNFSVDELAKYDLPAGIKKIREIKHEELDKDKASKTQYVFAGHSMGGMVLLMYLVNCRLSNQPHYLSKVPPE